MRINKFLAHSGLDSRRRVEDLIIQGNVKVNGVIINNLALQVNPERDTVLVNNKKVSLESKRRYVLLNKPKGYISTNHDPQGRPIARDLLPIKERLFSVGRLDENTEGLLIYTNDGDLAYKLAHPKFKIGKTYIAKIDRSLEEKDFEKIKKGGIIIEGSKVQPVSSIDFKNRAKTIVGLTITEGKKRQIRNVFKILGYNVLNLERIAIGKISIKGLPRGSYRFLNKSEIEYLEGNM